MADTLDPKQASFNAGMLDLARAFTLDAAQAAKINNVVDLQLAMQSYLWNAKMKDARALGFVLMPRWVEGYISKAWGTHGPEFIAIAQGALNTAKVAA